MYRLFAFLSGVIPLNVVRDTRDGVSGAWWRGAAPCILAGIVGISISLVSAGLIVQRDDQEAALQFRVTAENHFMVLQNGLNEYVNRLHAVRALFDSSEDAVTRNEFDAFTQPLLVEDTAIVTLSWVPRVLNSERAEHERSGVRQGLPGYRIKAMQADGKMITSPEHSEYYPIFYATVPKTSMLYGLDLRSEPATLQQLEQGRDNDRLGFSRIATLVTTDGTEGGFLFSLPIYKRGAPHQSVEDRRRNLAGFVHGSLNTGRMFDTIIIENKTPKGLDSFFFAPDAGQDDLSLYVHSSRLHEKPAEPNSQAALANGLHWSGNLLADGQPWLTMEVVAAPGGAMIARHDRAWIVLIFGLIVTGAIVTYIRSAVRHAVRMMRINRKVSDLAQTDALTGLVNRRAFIERLTAAIATCRRGGKPFAVLYFDLDRFKDVNDTLGHSIGDALLQQVAARVLSATRDNDVVARFGGDEFAVLQSDAEDVAAAGALAAKIGHVLAQPYVIAANEVHISASIGISHYTADVAGPDAMMIQADLALYRAKEEGRDCYRFHNADLDRQVQERVTIAEELRGAIRRDELELYYQPQVELASGRITGLEALLRWTHPKYGQVSPGVFIPIAERTGQIQALGRWVLDAACRQLKDWQDQGVAPQLIGVNVSALHFKGASELDSDVAASIATWKLPPKMLEIELTESVLMDVTQQHSDQFARLRQLGVRIAIDDFGTGYSSLSYLANYPINRVKIAQELVSGVDSHCANAAVVRAAIRLSHELGIEVIAEGVETEEQAKFLLAAGCEQGQGFYFGKPVDAQQTTALLRAGRIKPARALRVVTAA